MPLPSQQEMQKRMQTEIDWKRSWMPATGARAAIFQLHFIKYHDQLLMDMGLSPKRKSNPISELFVPYCARDYDDLFKKGPPATSKKINSDVNNG